MGASSSIQNYNASDCMDEKEWISKVETIRLDKYNVDGYQLFVQYLTDPQNISNDIIASVARVVREYASNTASVTLCDFTLDPHWSTSQVCNHTMQGVKLSIAIHPISGQLFIADQTHIYKYIRFNHLELIATLPYASSNDRITDLAFHGNGDELHYLLNNNLTAVYSLNHDDNKEISFYDFYLKSKQTMNIFKFDFTHFYLSDVCVRKHFANVPIYNADDERLAYCRDQQSRIWSEGTLYSMDMYRNEMWLVRNHGSHPPMLYRIKINSMDHSMTVMDKVEIIDEDMTYIVAVDVDKYFGGVYFISYTKILYRMQQINDTKEWKITRKKYLKDLIDNELPVGIYTIRFDSVMGRIIIADNYKIQAVYL